MSINFYGCSLHAYGWCDLAFMRPISLSYCCFWTNGGVSRPRLASQARSGTGLDGADSVEFYGHGGRGQR